MFHIVGKFKKCQIVGLGLTSTFLLQQILAQLSTYHLMEETDLSLFFKRDRIEIDSLYHPI